MASRHSRSAVLVVLLLGAVNCYAQSDLLGKYRAKGGDFFTVSSAKEGEIQIQMFGSYQENTCIIETGALKLSDSGVRYEPADDKDCHVRVTFRKGSATVQQDGNCGCGLNVNLSGQYHKQPASRSNKDAAKPN